MRTFTHTVTNEIGIHARPAGELVKLAKSFPDTLITIEKGGRKTDLTKLFMLLALCVKCGDTVTVTAEGADEDAAADAICKFMEDNL